MVTRETLLARRAAVATAGDLPVLLARLTERAAPLLERTPLIPDAKALLSADGGVCPACHGSLRFDPWEPTRHRCSSCGQVTTGERHDRHWARAQHLWVAERAAHLSTVGVLRDDERYGARARELLAAYHDRYFALPNRDNVLGPSHLFFSTYLESIWVLHYLAAAQILRAAGWLPDSEIEAVNAIADEAANLIGEFNEGMSNRQTWHSAALTAIAVWFADDELATSSIHGPYGLLGHLTDGFGDDGMWYEGENYHLFAIRGLLIGLRWARSAGVDLLENPELADHLGQALMAPALTALPDGTFPARKDSRFGVSLAHPAYLESWEAGAALLGDRGPAELAPWLHTLYRLPLRPAATYDAYLHDAGEPDRERTDRTDLSWWMAWEMAPELPPDTLPWRPASVLLPAQGLAVLRPCESRYISVECGGDAGGHAHPDQLHLTVYADHVHWLADPGAGSYVQRDLFWYRSGFAHNAPMVAGRPPADRAHPVAFDSGGGWGWIQAESGPVRRSVIAGPEWLVDLVSVDDASDRAVEVPWHFDGDVTVRSRGQWVADAIGTAFASGVERFLPEQSGPVELVAERAGRTLSVRLLGGAVLRARVPGRPGTGTDAVMIVMRGAPRERLIAVLDHSGTVAALSATAEAITVTAAAGPVQVQVGDRAAVVEGGGVAQSLGGGRPAERPLRRLITERPSPAAGEAVRVDAAPALDGTLDGFDQSAPIELADELHYRRSEAPWEGPEQITALAFVNWDEHALYVAVEVAKPEVVVRPPDSPPLELDNEPDDIHSDGIQIFLRVAAGPPIGYLIRPAPDGGIWARGIPAATDGAAVAAADGGPPPGPEGGSTIHDAGYTITVALPHPGLHALEGEPSIGFEIMVNEMTPDRVRRAGQLAWAGGGGWVYLRGDRPGPLGVLALAG